jgi:hypothetical protein
MASILYETPGLKMVFRENGYPQSSNPKEGGRPTSWGTALCADPDLSGTSTHASYVLPQ